MTKVLIGFILGVLTVFLAQTYAVTQANKARIEKPRIIIVDKSIELESV